MAFEKEINIYSVLEVVWARGKSIILFTLCAMLAGALISLLIKNRYQAVANVVMNKSKLGERTMANPAMPMTVWLSLARSRALAKELIIKYNLEDSPFNFEYIADVEQRIMVGLLGDGAIINIVVEMEDPEVATNMANDIAAYLIDKSQQIMEIEASSSVSQFRAELDKIRTEVDAKKETYRNMLLENNRELLTQELSTYNSILAKDKQEVENIKSAIMQMSTQVEKFEDVLSSTDFTKIIETRRNVVGDPIVLNTLRAVGGDQSIENLSRITFVDEQLNGGYIQLNQEYQKAKVDLAAQKALLQQKNARIAQVEQIVNELQRTISEMNIEEMIAKAEFDRSLEILSGIDKEEGWVGTLVASERQDLILMDPAIVPDKKIYPKRSMMVAVIGVIAFLISVVYFIVRDLYILTQSKS